MCNNLLFTISAIASVALSAMAQTSISAPTTITKSGSYVLTSNITAASGSPAISIQASYVVIDLKGFFINGNKVGTYGIYRSSSAQWDHLTIKNGNIYGFTQSGIQLEVQNGWEAGSGDVIDGITCSNNTNFGIYLRGPNFTVTNCICHGNNVGLYSCDIGGKIINCQFTANAMVGIQLATNGYIEGCSFRVTGTAIECDGINGQVMTLLNNTIHQCTIGVLAQGPTLLMTNNAIAFCTADALKIGNHGGGLFIGNMFALNNPNPSCANVDPMYVYVNNVAR